MSSIGIKGRLLASFAAVLLLVAAGIVPLMLNSLSDTMKRAEERELHGYHNALEAAVDAQASAAAGLARLVAEIPEVQDAFAAGDRDKLSALFTAGFETMKKSSGVDQFQFHLAPATSFFRVHMPKKFGDDLSSFRFTVVEANKGAKEVLGLEKGVGGLGVRAVIPMRQNGSHKGTVEFGLSFGQSFVDEFKKQYGIDTAIYVVNDKEGGFKAIAATNKEAFFAAAEFEQALKGAKETHIVRRGSRGATPVTAMAAPVVDFSGKPVAVVELVMDASEYAAQYSGTRTTALSVVGLVLVVGMGIAFLLARSISAPLVDITGVMRALAGGNLSVAVPSTARSDEVGEMARAVEVFKQQGVENRKLHDEQESSRAAAEAERKAAMARIADQLDASIGRVAETVGSASGELVATAESMAEMVAEAERRAATVAAAAEEASANVSTVAAATEELTSSITEISRQTAESTRIAGEAVEATQQADHRIDELNKAVVKIGEVVSFITDIASQTNLLALNATIEAARAGEAGKGFAVVANEVKHLASQTGKATEEISNLIHAVQSATHGAVDSIASIGQVVDRMSGVITTIAAAIEEQGAATQEISRNVQQAAEGTRQVSDNIAGVSNVVGETGRAASSVLNAGSDLAQQSDTLREEVRQSMAGIRAA